MAAETAPAGDAAGPKKTLALAGVTINTLALIAPGTYLGMREEGARVPFRRLTRSTKRPQLVSILCLLAVILSFVGTAHRGYAQDAKPSGSATPAPAVAAIPTAASTASAAAVATAAPPPAADPAGVATGDKTSVSDAGGNSFVPAAPADTDDTATKADKQKALDEYNQQAKTEPLATKLADGVGHLRIATNFAWTLNTGYLVLFMQAGFGLLTCGLIRKKNAAHLMMLNFAAYVVAFVAYYAVGFAFMYGGIAATPGAPSQLGGVPTLTQGLHIGGQLVLGTSGWFLTGPAYDSGVNVLMLFEVVFMETAGYIIVGAVCERITFAAFILAEIFIGAILYPIFGCWVWGGGWLSQIGTTMHLGHGYVDFAGSTVVHAVGGFAAMALAVILGPRLGKYDKNGKPVAFPAHNIVFVVTGTFILLFGWMGFNPGSTLAATDLRISVIAINTNLAAVFGSATAMIFWTLRYKKPDISMACNGMLAGLVAITAPCAFVDAPSACVIGVLAGLLVCFGVVFNERVLKVDDPCGAVSVHGYCGWLGGVCVGIFADGKYGSGWNGTGATEYLGTKGANLLGVTGLVHGDSSQFVAQLIGSTICVVWSFGLTFIVFKIVNAVKSLRVSRDVEMEGLDLPEFGALAYPEDGGSSLLSFPDPNIEA